MPTLKDARTAADLRRLFGEQIATEVQRISSAVDTLLVEREIDETFAALEATLNGSDMRWLTDLPGKPIFSKFAARANIEKGRLKTMYIAEARRRGFAPFKEIISIFASFSGRSADSGTGSISLRKSRPRSTPSGRKSSAKTS